MSSHNERHIDRVCEQCGKAFSSPASWVGRFCSNPCKYAWRRAQPKRWNGATIRRLRNDEPIPESEPKRYRAGTGYIVLRWKIGLGQYVEALEHRIVTGRVSEEVHHINRVKHDNSSENLKPVTNIEHGTEHSTWDVTAACDLYRAGWSLPRLAKFFGKREVLIMRALKLRGVVMRTRQEAWILRKAR